MSNLESSYKYYKPLDLIKILSEEYLSYKNDNYQFSDIGLRNYLAILTVYELNTKRLENFQLLQEVGSNFNLVFYYSKNYVLNLLDGLSDFQKKKFNSIITSTYQITQEEGSYKIEEIFNNDNIIEFVEEDLISKINMDKLINFGHQVSADISDFLFIDLLDNQINKFIKEFKSSSTKNLKEFVLDRIENSFNLLDKISLAELELLLNSFDLYFNNNKFPVRTSIRSGLSFQNSEFLGFEYGKLEEVLLEIINDIERDLKMDRGIGY